MSEEEDYPDWVQTWTNYIHRDIWKLVAERLDRLEENRHLAVDPSEGPRNWNLGESVREGVVKEDLAMKVLSIGEIPGGNAILESYSPKEQTKPSRQEIHDYCKRVSNFMFNSSEFRDKVAFYWREFVAFKLVQREALNTKFVLKQNELSKAILINAVDRLDKDIDRYRYYEDRSKVGIEDRFLEEDPSLSSSSPKRKPRSRDNSPRRKKVSSPDYQVY